MTDEEFERAYQLLLEEAKSGGVMISPSKDGKGHIYVGDEEVSLGDRIVEILSDLKRNPEIV